MRTPTTLRRVALAGAAALVLAACGGSDGDDASDADDAPADEPAEQPAEEAADDGAEDDGAMDDSAADDGAGDEAAGDDGAADGGSGGFEPGDVAFRSINLLDRPVDIYVRTTGLVEAFPVEAGVTPQTVTDYAAPPAEGRYIVTEPGAGDPTCVVDCDHFVAELSAAFGEGPTRTVILYEDDFSGASAMELSEEPDSVESAAGSANLLRPADPSRGIVFPVGVALDEDVFGYRVSFDAVDGCVEAIDQENILVGGNQTPAYPYPGDSAELQLFEQPDQDCESPVATFDVEGGPGTRTLVVLEGGSEAPPTGIIVELSGSVEPVASASDDGAADDGAGDDGAADDGAGDDAAPESREELIDGLLADAPPGTDPECVSDVINRLSDEDVQLVLDNIDSPDVPPLSDEGLITLSEILNCAPA